MHGLNRVFVKYTNIIKSEEILKIIHPSIPAIFVGIGCWNGWILKATVIL